MMCAYDTYVRRVEMDRFKKQTITTREGKTMCVYVVHTPGHASCQDG